MALHRIYIKWFRLMPAVRRRTTVLKPTSRPSRQALATLDAPSLLMHATCTDAERLLTVQKDFLSRASRFQVNTHPPAPFHDLDYAQTVVLQSPSSPSDVSPSFLRPDKLQEQTSVRVWSKCFVSPAISFFFFRVEPP